MTITNENLPDPDFDDEDEMNEIERPDGYECVCCGHVQSTWGFGGECDKCCGPTTEFYF